MTRTWTAREIIVALGGTRAVAETVGVGRNVASQWYRIGIPGKYWPQLARCAAASDSPETRKITLDVLEGHTRPSASSPAPVQQDAAA